MKPNPTSKTAESGKIGWMALLWIVGVPLPIVLIIGLLSSCN
jgi:hypothetical protein